MFEKRSNVDTPHVDIPHPSSLIFRSASLLGACIHRLLGTLKTDFVAVAAGPISAQAAGERNRGGRGALALEDARELVSCCRCCYCVAVDWEN